MKIIEASRLDSCIGCQLCVVYSSLIRSGVMGVADAFIHVSPQADDGYSFRYDPAFEGGQKELEQVVEICPRNCLELVEVGPSFAEASKGNG